MRDINNMQNIVNLVKQIGEPVKFNAVKSWDPSITEADIENSNELKLENGMVSIKQLERADIPNYAEIIKDILKENNIIDHWNITGEIIGDNGYNLEMLNTEISYGIGFEFTNHEFLPLYLEEEISNIIENFYEDEYKEHIAEDIKNVESIDDCYRIIKAWENLGTELCEIESLIGDPDNELNKLVPEASLDDVLNEMEQLAAECKNRDVFTKEKDTEHDMGGFF